MSLPTLRFERSRDSHDALTRAASETGIDSEYWDMFGHRHTAPSETLQRILQSLGWNTSTVEDIDRKREGVFRKENTFLLQQVNVVDEDDRNVRLTFAAAEQENATLSFDLSLEDGNSLSGSFVVRELEQAQTIECDGDQWTVRLLRLPSETPLGYHRLTITNAGKPLAQAPVILCPSQAYLPPVLEGSGKLAGFNVTLYGLRSERNWGCGDFTDLQQLSRYAGALGFAFVGLNPLHALHNRVPFNTSPYLPLSIFYKNLIYIDVTAVAEWNACGFAERLFQSAKTQALIASLRDAETVQYSGVHRLKRVFLKLLFKHLRRTRDASLNRWKAFDEYCQREGELLHNFATYCALDEVLHKQDRNRWTWPQWPVQYHSPNSEACATFAKQHTNLIGFYKYVQFVLNEQLAAAQVYAREVGLSIGLYHDLALATDSYGADLWAYPNFFVKGCRVGAPPDDLSPNGQDWAFPPPNGNTHRAMGYRLYRESLRKIMEHGGALRIDHVMRLFRLFWIPDGVSAASGTYVRDHALELMRVLALESVRNRNVVIGEDLGTVTDAIRESLGSFRVLSYRLFPFERDDDGTYKSSQSFPRKALVSSSTHDLATLTGFWINRDIEARRAAGLLDEHGYEKQLKTRVREKQKMLDRLHEEGLLPPDYERNAQALAGVDGPLHNAIIGFLARVPSMLLLLNQEDLTLESEQQNLPGSTSEYPNWQRKMRATIEELHSEKWKPYNAMFRAQLKTSGRASLKAC